MLIVGSIRKLMRIGRWSVPRLVFVCQLVIVIREADANETYGEDGLTLLGSFVGESQLSIPKFEPEIIFSNMLPLVSVELEYHADWCALKSHSIRVSVVIIRWSRERGCRGDVDVGNDQPRISQLDSNDQLFQVWFC